MVYFCDWTYFRKVILANSSSLTEISPAGEHISDIYITETDTTELEILSHNIIDIFIIET